jgi:hypothetical protein
MFDPEIKTISGPPKSRWSRVERKALVFFPTLNERLSVRKISFQLVSGDEHLACRNCSTGWQPVGRVSQDG